MKHEPAKSIIELMGGTRPLARRLSDFLGETGKVDPSTVDRWQRAKPRGCGGTIPSKYHRPLLDLARAENKTLTADELIYGVAMDEAG